MKIDLKDSKLIELRESCSVQFGMRTYLGRKERRERDWMFGTMVERT